MPDKFIDVEKFGTVQENELGLELDDQRGRQDNRIVNKLFPQSAGGGGQSAQAAVITRYRPGNRYKYVRFNGTIVQYDGVRCDITFATELQRDSNVIQCATDLPLAGVFEQGSGGPLTTDPALTSHPAGTFGFITTRGLAIANVNAAVVANEMLGPEATAGRLSTLAVTTPTAAETVRLRAAATGLGVLALVTEPATGFKANLTLVKLT